MFLKGQIWLQLTWPSSTFAISRKIESILLSFFQTHHSWSRDFLKMSPVELRKTSTDSLTNGKHGDVIVFDPNSAYSPMDFSDSYETTPATSR